MPVTNVTGSNPGVASISTVNTVASYGSGASTGGISTQAGTTYTLAAADNGTRIRFTSNSPITLTVPAGLGAGFSVTIEQDGTAQITFTASGTTINNVSGYTKTLAQYAVTALLGGAADVYTLTGSVGT